MTDVNILGVIIAGLSAAVVFSMFTAMARAMGMTTMSIEKTLGAMFAEGTIANVIGTLMHLVSGIVFAFVYAVIFAAVGAGASNGWLIGGILGLAHGLMVGAVVMPMMGTIHPAVKAGTMTAPGFFAINRGEATPAGMIVGHIIFGVVLGFVYFLIV